MITHPLAAAHWEPGVEQLLTVLNPWLVEHWQTCLVAAADEPYYAPADGANGLHQIQFAHGYFNSALHELAHWCVAGEQRRLLPDFGYWYAPDGRDAAQQAAFEKVEVKPQAIEWHFAEACGRHFRVSVDNLSGEPTDSRPFQEAVRVQANQYLRDGLPARANALVALMCQAYGTDRHKFRFQ